MGLELAKAFVTIRVDSSQVSSGLSAVVGDVTSGLNQVQSQATAAMSQATSAIKQSVITAAGPWTLIADAAKLVQPPIMAVGQSLQDVSMEALAASKKVKGLGFALGKFTKDAQGAKTKAQLLRNAYADLADITDEQRAVTDKLHPSLRQTQTTMKEQTQATFKVKAAANQAVFGIQDFIQVLSQPGMGLSDALRASANNMQQMVAVMGLGGLWGVAAGLALAIVPAVAGIFDMGEAAKEAEKEIDSLLGRLKSLKKFMDDLRESRSKRLLGPAGFDERQVRENAKQQGRARKERIAQLEAERIKLVRQGPEKTEVPIAGTRGNVLEITGKSIQEHADKIAAIERELVKKREDEAEATRLVGEEIASIREGATRKELDDLEDEMNRKQDQRERETKAVEKQRQTIEKVVQARIKEAKSEEDIKLKAVQKIRDANRNPAAVFADEIEKLNVLVQKFGLSASDAEGEITRLQSKIMKDRAQQIRKNISQQQRFNQEQRRGQIGFGRTTFADLGKQIQDNLFKQARRQEQLEEQKKASELLRQQLRTQQMTLDTIQKKTFNGLGS